MNLARLAEQIHGKDNLSDIRDAIRRAAKDRNGAKEDDVGTALDQLMKDKDSVEAIYRLYTSPEKPDYMEIGRIVAQQIQIVHARYIQDWMP